MTETTPQTIFNRAHLRRNRARWADRFAAHNILFEDTATGLLERLPFIKREFSSVLEIGSRDNQISNALLKDNPSRHIVRMALNNAPGLSVIGDDEFLPFGANSFDLIISNLNLHWANDVPGALIQARRALKPDGFFLCALLGGETLHELRACLYEAESQIRGGVSPRVSPFMDLRDGAALMQRAGYTLPVADREKLVLTYPDIFALMRELRFMGEAHTAIQKEKRFTPRTVFARAGEIYMQRFPAEGGIRATFEILVLSGWAVHESQQKPLQPGQAQHSLATALQTAEIKTNDSAAPGLLRRG